MFGRALWDALPIACSASSHSPDARLVYIRISPVCPSIPPERRVRPRVHAVTLSPTSRPSLFFQLIHLPILGMNTDLLMTPFFAGIGVVDDCGCRVSGTWAVPGFWHEAPDVLVRQWANVHTSSRGLGGRSVPLSVQNTSFAINFFLEIISLTFGIVISWF